MFSRDRQAPFILESLFYLYVYESMEARDWHGWMSSLITLHIKTFYSIYLCIGSWLHTCLYVPECVHMCMQVNMRMHMWGPEEVDSSDLRLQAFVGHRDSYVCARI